MFYYSIFELFIYSELLNFSAFRPSRCASQVNGHFPVLIQFIVAWFSRFKVCWTGGCCVCATSYEFPDDVFLNTEFEIVDVDGFISFVHGSFYSVCWTIVDNFCIETRDRSIFLRSSIPCRRPFHHEWLFFAWERRCDPLCWRQFQFSNFSSTQVHYNKGQFDLC